MTTSILDQVAKSVHSAFRPQSTRDYFALQLARRLEDVEAASHYAELVGQHSEETLLAAYRQTLVSKQSSNLAPRFHLELPKAGQGNGLSSNRHRLLVFFLQRRSIAVAIFIGDHVDYTQIKQLSSTHEKAIVSAMYFARWLLETFKVQSAAIEVVPAGNDIQRGMVTSAVRDCFRSEGTPVWEIPKSQLFNSFGFPPLRSRREVREVVSNIWPILKTGRADDIVRDALALGLHVQIESRFNQ